MQRIRKAEFLGGVASVVVESYALVNTPQTPRSGWSVPSETTVLQAADGVPIYASVRGSGDIAVVVVHGFSGGHRHGSHARLLGWFEKHFTVIAIDQRGHGSSGGGCTLSYLEVLDLDAAVAWARERGAKQVVTVGFSMGCSTVLRHAALTNPNTVRSEYDQQLVVTNSPDAVIGVGGAAYWYFRGSRQMYLLHTLVKFGWGRKIIKDRFGVNLSMNSWPEENDPRRLEIQPLDPTGSVAAAAPLPLLIVHGSKDNYFPDAHAHQLIASAQSVEGNRADLWYEIGMGHAESGTTQPLVERIATWITTSTNSSDSTDSTKRVS